MEGINSFGLQEAIQLLLETGRASKLGQIVEIHGKPAMITQGRDGGIEPLSLAEFMHEPERIRNTATFDNVPSFVEYVMKFKTDDTLLTSTCVRFKVESGNALPVISADIDYHGPEAPSRNTHKAVLQFQLTPEADVWFKNNGKEKSQMDFADFIEDHMHRITEPSGADLMELVQTLSITEKATFKSRKRKPDGSFCVDYSTDADASAGGVASYEQLEVPGEFTVQLPIFEGDGEMQNIKARMRFKMSREHGLTMWYKLVDVTELIRARLMALCGEVEEGTELTVMFGNL